MDAVAVHGQRGEEHVVALEGIEPFIERLIVVQKDLGVGVIVARIAAAADLDRFDAGRFQFGEGLIERLFRVEVFADADFHESSPLKMAREKSAPPPRFVGNQNL